MARLDDDAFRTRWNVCNTNGDDLLDFEENQSCAHRVAAAYGFESVLGEIMKEMMADPHIREFYVCILVEPGYKSILGCALQR